MANVSVLGAADRAIQETRRRLFPARLDRWFTLGFIAFLEQCGEGAGSGWTNIPTPGGGSSGGGDGGGAEGGGGVDPVLTFIAEHVLLVVAIAAAVLVVVLAVTAIVAWIKSRGTFMYLDSVATGRADLGRSWREHSERASSYFTWLFGTNVVFLLGVLVLLVPVVWSAVRLLRHGRDTGAIAVLAASIVALLLFALLGALLGIALRDFVAPLQWSSRLPCGGALRLFLGIAAAHPGVFIVFVLAKMVFAVLSGVTAMLVGCVTCCCGLMPVVRQTILQPLFYFERRWSLELLADLGHAMPSAPAVVLPAAPTPPAEPAGS
jgi:hypothetical protein